VSRSSLDVVRNSYAAAWRLLWWRRFLVLVVAFGWLFEPAVVQIWPAVSSAQDTIQLLWFLAGNIISIEYLRFTVGFSCPRCGYRFFGPLPPFPGWDWTSVNEMIRRLFGWGHRCQSCRLRAGAGP
jgi:hypothetical protein